jgi:hypothetical protein
VQGLHNVQADVEPNQIGEGERAHRMRHAELHHLIDRFPGGDSILKGADRLVDHRQQDAVRDKAWRVIHNNWRFADRLGKRHRSLHGLLGSLEPTHDFDEWQDRHGIEEVQPEKVGRTPRSMPKRGNGNRRRVGSKQDTRRSDARQIGEKRCLGLALLDNRFYDELSIRGRLQ